MPAPWRMNCGRCLNRLDNLRNSMGLVAGSDFKTPGMRGNGFLKNPINLHFKTHWTFPCQKWLKYADNSERWQSRRWIRPGMTWPSTACSSCTVVSRRVLGWQSCRWANGLFLAFVQGRIGLVIVIHSLSNQFWTEFCRQCVWKPWAIMKTRMHCTRNWSRATKPIRLGRMQGYS